MLDLVKYTFLLLGDILVEIKDIIIGIVMAVFKLLVLLPYVAMLGYYYLIRKYFKDEIVIYTPGNPECTRKAIIVGYCFLNGRLCYELESERTAKTSKLTGTYKFIAGEDSLTMDSINYMKKQRYSIFKKIYKRLFK